MLDYLHLDYDYNNKRDIYSKSCANYDNKALFLFKAVKMYKQDYDSNTGERTKAYDETF